MSHDTVMGFFFLRHSSLRFTGYVNSYMLDICLKSLSAILIDSAVKRDAICDLIYCYMEPNDAAKDAANAGLGAGGSPRDKTGAESQAQRGMSHLQCLKAVKDSLTRKGTSSFFVAGDDYRAYFEKTYTHWEKIAKMVGVYKRKD